MSDEAQIERRDPEQDFGMNLQMANGVYVQATYPAGDDDRDIRFDWEVIERVAAAQGGDNYLARCLILARDREIPR
jgi:hypothetical protein